ncbi:MAG: enoyl-CoA hydratase [Chloroflexota bacterium]|nr:enoyl-CoA hydratase [Chloroflexota bacterium]
MLDKAIVQTYDEGIAILTLNNPDRRNVLSMEVLEALQDTLLSISLDPDVHVVIIKSTGPVFSSGHDLKQLINGSMESQEMLFAACTGVMTSIRNLPQPVIAQVQGLATAAGCQLVATCDLAIASSDASFATPGVQIGLFCTTPGVAVSRTIGTKKTMEMLLTGQPISADDAVEVGLINRVVSAEDLEQSVLDFAKQICGTSSYTVTLGKQAFYKQLEMGISDAYQLAGETMVRNLQNQDAKEGISAFLEKRAPKWTN